MWLVGLENSIGVYVNVGCFGIGFNSWFKTNLNSCCKEGERKQ